MLKRLIRDHKKNIYRTGGCSRRSRAGFTMAEVLMVVAIIGILAAIAAPAAGTIQKRMRQTELDSKAEIIYTAAQTQISKMKAGATDDIIQPEVPAHKVWSIVDASGSFTIPGDADPAETEEGSLYYFTSEDVGSGTAAESVMATGLIEQELLNHTWIVEFSPQTGMVYSVFYSEAETDLASRYKNPTNDHLDNLREKDARLTAGATVGYYRGNTASAKRAATLKPHVEIHNEDALTAEIWCDRPSGVTNNLSFLVTVEDAYGTSYSKWYAVDAKRGEEDGHDIDMTGQLKVQGYRYSMTLTLDDLSATDDSKRFYKLYGVESSHAADERLVSGTNIKVSVRVFCPQDTRVDKSRLVTDESNSLYDYDPANSKTTAYISNPRHLQNLEWTASQNAEIVLAKQTKDIDFHDDESQENWFDTRPFTPIKNSRLTEYLVEDTTETDDLGNTVAHHPVIMGLNVTKDGGGAGLFGTLYGGQKVTGVYLTGMTVNGKYAGALAGTVALDDSELGGRVDKDNGVMISGCRCYLEEVDYKNNTYSDPWAVPTMLDGEEVGGLVGRLDSGKLFVEESQASTMVGHITLSGDSISSASTSVGGLIGRVQSGSEAYISDSYADDYLRGTNMGGLVGESDGKVEITDSYSAGYVYMHAGLFGAGIGLPGNNDFSMDRCYTIMTCLYRGELLEGIYYATAPKGTGTTAYYQEWNHNTAEGVTAIGTAILSLAEEPTQIIPALLGALNTGGSAFQTDRMDTVAYNLLDQGLSAYKYPMLDKVALHYGDWSAAFQKGALLYYEKYAFEKYLPEDGTYVPVDPSTLQGKNDANGNPVNEYGYSSGAGIGATLQESEVIVEGSTYRVHVVGDGYAVIYLAADAPTEVKYKITGSDSGTVSGICDVSEEATHRAIGKDGATYKLYPLPVTANNIKPSTDDFYMQIVIDRSDADPETYYFNPHFANTVSGSPSQVVNHGVTIRTPRHLYMLSKYFPEYYYNTVSANVTYYQERNADYAEYDWPGFYGGSSTIIIQDPIGDDSHHFKSTYDGGCHWISNVSIVAQSSSYVGLFAYNEGTIEDAVLTVEYSKGDANSHRIQRKGNVNTNQSVYMGTICGYNKGEITNTAVSGYYIAGKEGTIFAYSSSNLRAGGFVGGNAGTIKNCSADCPEILVSPTYANCWLGGFVGRNTGTIRSSYALGHIEVVQPKEGSIKLAGFAAANSGSITKSYCATALTGSGTTTTSYGFSPMGGSVSGCYYLNGGTYTYIGRMYAYDFDTSKTAGVAKKQQEMKEKASDAHEQADADHTFSFKNTKSITGAYPYVAVVRERNSDGRYGAYVHYGDWQNDLVMGVCGIFYWENEENGTNNGIHITYLGYDADSTAIPYVTGTSLCTAHDDGGMITSYGYGYYKKIAAEGETLASLTNHLNGLTYSDSTINTEVRDNLKNQISGYEFYPYTTPNPYTTSNYNNLTGDYIWLSGGADELNANYGTWTMTYGSKAIDFKVAPFFANAMSVNDASIPSGEKPVLSKDLIDTDFSTLQGTNTNHYEIRSISQLQYINWNFKEKSALKTVEEKTSDNYSYLQHATKTAGTNNYEKPQARSSVEGKRATESFRQSHDLNGLNYVGFVPIAGGRKDGIQLNYDLRAWFGGNYDGQSYTIKNLSITSDCHNVGLFGTTVGARLENIILYSDQNSKIQRLTAANNKQCAYLIGGLAGVAYDYANATEEEKKKHEITNCAIAGYKIEDNTQSPQYRGGANIGGLIGCANVNLNNCSAVVDILANANYKDTINGKCGQYGNYVRIGGVAGILQYKMVNCYSGGSIKVAKELRDDYDPVDNKDGWLENDIYSDPYVAANRWNTHIYIGGMAGSAYPFNPQNITGKGDSEDGDMTFENCYTYMEMPMMTGRIRGISMIGSVADRYWGKNGSSKTIKISNCYYLEGCAPTVDETYEYRNTWATKEQGVESIKLGDIMKEKVTLNGLEKTVYEWMLLGNLQIVNQIGLHDSGPNRPNSRGGIKDDGTNKDVQLINIDLLSMRTDDDPNSGMDYVLNGGNPNGPWSFVTVEEGEGEDKANVDGKYSFTSGNAALTGKNYPFPTIIKQRDLVASSLDAPAINVHYGEWPLTSMYWSHGRASLDIFDKMGTDGIARATFKLYDSEHVSGSLSPSDFTVHAENSTAQIAQIESVTWNESDNAYDVVVKALNVGSVTIYPSILPAYSFDLDVTANLEVTAAPANMELVKGDANKQTLILTAKSMGDGTEESRKDYSTDGVRTETAGAQDNRWSVVALPGSYLHLDQQVGAINKWDVTRDSYERSSEGPIIIGATYYYYYNGVELPFSTQVTVTYPPYDVTLELDANGGTWSNNTAGSNIATVAYNATTTLNQLINGVVTNNTLTPPTGATFQGWSSDGTAANILSTDVLGKSVAEIVEDATLNPNPFSTGTMTLKAVYDTPTSTTVNVNFEINNVTTVTGQTSPYATISETIGANYVLPYEPYVEGYVFEGWFTDTGYTAENLVTTSTIVPNSATAYSVYAKWTPAQTVSVTFDANGGTWKQSDGTTDATSPLTAVNVPVNSIKTLDVIYTEFLQTSTDAVNVKKEGQVLIGWDNSFEESLQFATWYSTHGTGTDPITFNAQWASSP